ncbi:hypothetical protein C6P45_000938 [Maudiozyma exigua]|uniref:Uncharacterized protein n=1 Tax=Maudiozyma exigua TaxID=34358 RepID=A0A9P7B4U1_MAUEX|nr:hypothetical protein C6P45_001736 [Kazachstania exigua]KAG0662986.1 hypothetical protein C6P45_000938 [Kazachstania exigua]
MDKIKNNDSIILKGTSFKSKPIFASFKYPRFDALVKDLMMRYGNSILTGNPIKGKEQISWEEGSSIKSRPVPIPLQLYFLPFYYSMLLVVGSDKIDTLTLTSPIAQNVRKLFGFRKLSKKTESYMTMLKTIECKAEFVPLTYNCTTIKLERNWHKTVHLRERDVVQLYVVPKPLEYFPMLFVNCSMDNIRCIYDNITALMISRNDPLYYCPQLFTYAIFRPVIFNIVENFIKYRQRLPGIDVTDEEFVIRRTEWLDRESRYMRSDCMCRSNTTLLPSDESWYPISWDKVELLFYHYNCNIRHQHHPPYYAQKHKDCQGHCD